MYTSTRLEWHQDVRREFKKPRRVLCGLARQQAELLIRVIRFAVALAKSQDHRASCGVFAFGQTGHRQTAFKAAVTVLRGNGGSFPSQAQMSDPQGCAGTGRRDALRRVILQAVQSVRHSPMYVPDLSEIYMVLTNLVHSGLGEYCPIRTRLN